MKRSRELISVRGARARKRKHIVCAVAMASVSLLAACSSGSASAGADSPGVSKSEVKLAATTVLSGPVGASCSIVTKATQAWFDAVNAKGGVNGRKITWNLQDDAYDPARAAANARSLVSGDVFALFGGCGSAEP